MDFITDEVEEVNCVFCGKLFESIEKIQEHITKFHEALPNDHVDNNLKQESSYDQIQDVHTNNNNNTNNFKVYDLNTELIPSDRNIDYNTIVQCSKCRLYFINSYASRVHFEKKHLTKKRKLENNQNGGVETKFRDILPSSKTEENRRKRKKRVLVLSNPVNEVLETDQNGGVNGQHKMEILQNGFDKIDTNGKVEESWNKPKSDEVKENSEEVLEQQSINVPSGTAPQRYGYQQKKSYRCPHCSTIFINKESYKRHVLLHQSGSTVSVVTVPTPTQTGVHQCQSCGARFGRLKKLKRHQQTCSMGSQTLNDKAIDIIEPKNEVINYHDNNSTVATQLNNGHTTANNPTNKSNKSIGVNNHSINNNVNKTTNNSESLNPRDLKFAEKFLENPAIILNKGSQCVCNLCQSCFYSNQSVLKHLVLYHRISPQDGSQPLLPKPLPIIISSVVSTSSVPQANSNSTINKPIKPLTNSIANNPTAPTPPTNPSNGGLDANCKIQPILPKNRFSSPDLLTLNFIQSCQFCNSQFASKKGLHRHLQTVHQNEINTTEPSNNQSNSINQSNHSTTVQSKVSTTSTAPKRIRCDICKKRFRNPILLQQHRQIYHSDVVDSGATTTSNNISDKSANNNVDLPPLEEKPDYVAIKTSINNLSYKSNNGNNNSNNNNNNSTSTNTSRRHSAPYSIPTYKKAKVPPNADGLFECDVCNKAFTCRSSLSNHVKSHFNFKNKPFSCSACQQGFMSTLTLQHHREYLCPNLKRSNSDDSDQTTHCSVNGPSQLDLNQSNSNTGSNGNGSHNTPAISNNFDGVSQVPYSSALANVVDCTNGNNSLTTRATSCMHCSAMFPDRSLLEDHASKEHSNSSGEVVCILCPRSFTTYMAFRVHMTKSHGGPNGTSLKSALNAAAAAVITSSASSSNHPNKLGNNLKITELSHSPHSYSSSPSSASSSSIAQQIQQHNQPNIYEARPPNTSPSSSFANSILPNNSSSSNYLSLPNNVNNNSHPHPHPIIHNNVTTIGATGRIYNTRHACPNCEKDFSTSQALGNHKRACMPHLYKKN